MPDLTTAQAASELQVTPDTVVRYCAAGDLPGAYRLKRRWRIPPDALAALREPAPVLLAPRSRRSAAQQKRNTA